MARSMSRNLRLGWMRSTSQTRLFGLHGQIIDDAVDAEYVPSVHLGHLSFGVVEDQPFQRDHRIADRNADAIGIDEGILFEHELDRLGDLAVAIFLIGHYLEAVDDIAAARHPPCEHSGKPLVRKAAHLTVQGHDAVINYYVNPGPRSDGWFPAGAFAIAGADA